MKIGILTYHRSHNYGALLQAIALRKVLNDLGHEAYFVDYWPNYHRRMYALFDIQGFKDAGKRYKLELFKRFSQSFPLKLKRINVFKKFIKENIEPYAIPYSSETKFDAIIYGSDQIWRKQWLMGNRYNPIYFGDNTLQANRHIAYSASMGVLPTDQESLDFLKEKIGKLDAVAVRESDLAELLRGIMEKTIEQTIDPTLLLNGQEWEQIIDIPRQQRKPYVLFYDLMPDSFSLAAIRRYADERELELVILKSKAEHFLPQKDILETAGPAEFLSLVRDAHTVFTSSFHGLVFALNFRRPVYAAFSRNAGRAASILSALKLDATLLNPLTAQFPDYSYDWEIVSQHLERIKSRSLAVLKTAVYQKF